MKQTVFSFLFCMFAVSSVIFLWKKYIYQDYRMVISAKESATTKDMVSHTTFATGHGTSVHKSS